METIVFIIWVVAAIVSILLIVAIFDIKSYTKKQTEILDQQTKILDNQSEMLEYQNKVLIAQLNLLSSIADKAGVPLKDINDVTKDFDIEFEE